MNDSRNDTKNPDWDNRVLCSDESCIGIIGDDGRCTECGLPYQGELPLPKEEGRENESDIHALEEEAEEAEETAEEDKAGESDADDEWAKRLLCSDESCIGVIGPDGRCKECGKPYQP